MTSLETATLVEVAAIISAVKSGSPTEIREAADSLLASPDAWAAVVSLAGITAAKDIDVEHLAAEVARRVAAEWGDE